MLIAGISLQLLAGIMFGLPHILPEDRFQGADERLRRFLLFPSKGKQRLRILLFGALIIPLASILIAAYLLEGPGAHTEVQWFEAVGGGLLGSLMAGVLYLSLLRRFAQLISRTKDPTSLPDEAYFRTLLFGNLALIAVLGGLGWLSIWGGSVLSSAQTANVPQAVVLIPTILLILFGSLSVLSACISFVFVVLAGIIRLMSLMARPARILWIIVLSLYVLGGAFLLGSAFRP
jgi:hypothetical protein